MRCRARRLADVLTGNGRTSGCRLVRVALESSARRSVRSIPLVEHTALLARPSPYSDRRASTRARIWPNDCLRYSSFEPENEARPFRVALDRLLLTLANASPPRTTAERALPGTSSTSFRLCSRQPSSGLVPPPPPPLLRLLWAPPALLPPLLEAPGEFEIAAARDLLIPFFRNPSPSFATRRIACRS